MDVFVVILCVFLVVFSFYLVIRGVVQQLRGCSGCPYNCVHQHKTGRCKNKKGKKGVK